MSDILEVENPSTVRSKNRLFHRQRVLTRTEVLRFQSDSWQILRPIIVHRGLHAAMIVE